MFGESLNLGRRGLLESPGCADDIAAALAGRQGRDSGEPPGSRELSLTTTTPPASGGVYPATPFGDATVDLLLASAGAQQGDAARLEQVRRKVAKAETEMHRLQDAITAGANPAALVDAINQAHEQHEAAHVELEGLPAGRTLSRADVYAMIDYLGDVGDALNDAHPARR